MALLLVTLRCLCSLLTHFPPWDQNLSVLRGCSWSPLPCCLPQDSPWCLCEPRQGAGPRTGPPRQRTGMLGLPCLPADDLLGSLEGGAVHSARLGSVSWELRRECQDPQNSVWGDRAGGLCRLGVGLGGAGPLLIECYTDWRVPTCPCDSLGLSLCWSVNPSMFRTPQEARTRGSVHPHDSHMTASVIKWLCLGFRHHQSFIPTP